LSRSRRSDRSLGACLCKSLRRGTLVWCSLSAVHAYREFVRVCLACTHLGLKEVVDESGYKEWAESKVAPEPKYKEEDVGHRPPAVSLDAFDTWFVFMKLDAIPGLSLSSCAYVLVHIMQRACLPLRTRLRRIPHHTTDRTGCRHGRCSKAERWMRRR
jgi:hypothetical protein